MPCGEMDWVCSMLQTCQDKFTHRSFTRQIVFSYIFFFIFTGRCHKNNWFRRSRRWNWGHTTRNYGVVTVWLTIRHKILWIISQGNNNKKKNVYTKTVEPESIFHEELSKVRRCIFMHVITVFGVCAMKLILSCFLIVWSPGWRRLEKCKNQTPIE